MGSNAPYTLTLNSYLNPDPSDPSGVILLDLREIFPEDWIPRAIKVKSAIIPNIIWNYYASGLSSHLIIGAYDTFIPVPHGNYSLAELVSKKNVDIANKLATTFPGVDIQFYLTIDSETGFVSAHSRLNGVPTAFEFDGNHAELGFPLTLNNPTGDYTATILPNVSITNAMVVCCLQTDTDRSKDYVVGETVPLGGLSVASPLIRLPLCGTFGDLLYGKNDPDSPYFPIVSNIHNGQINKWLQFYIHVNPSGPMYIKRGYALDSRWALLKKNLKGVLWTITIEII